MKEKLLNSKQKQTKRDAFPANETSPISLVYNNTFVGNTMVSTQLIKKLPLRWKNKNKKMKIRYNVNIVSWHSSLNTPTDNIRDILIQKLEKKKSQSLETPMKCTIVHTVIGNLRKNAGLFHIFSLTKDILEKRTWKEERNQNKVNKKRKKWKMRLRDKVRQRMKNWHQNKTHRLIWNIWNPLLLLQMLQQH